MEYAAGEAERLNLPTTAEGTSLKLFVGGIPVSMSDEDLREYFSEYGQVTECHVLPQKTSNPLIQTKAAFVRFARKADGLRAIETLDKKVSFPGVERSMDVRIAEGKEAKTAGDDRMAPRQYQQQQQQHQQYQPQQHQQQQQPQQQRYAMPIQQQAQSQYPQQAVPMPPMRPPRTIGAWTEYYAPDGRPYYYNAMTAVTSWDPPVEFRIAGPPAMPSPPVYQPPASAVPTGTGGADAKGPSGSNLFVFHVPAEWTENELFTQFAPYGNIVSYRIARERETNRPKGFAFVSYDNAGSAMGAIAGLNGMVVSNGKRLKVSIKKGEDGGQPQGGSYANPY